jgi:hypothetical protein
MNMTASTFRTYSELAARNNAAWCDAVFRAHGRPGEFRPEIWINRNPAPRLYPNAVTLSRPLDSSAQLIAIQELFMAGPPGGWSVKDSFCTLDLAPLGLGLLFEATWLWRAPGLPASQEELPGVGWSVLHDPSELERWEAAWNGPLPAGTLLPPPQFPPVLLADPDLAFIAAWRAGEIVAGAVANRTGPVLGLSNVFTPAEEVLAFWAGCVAAVWQTFPSLPLVGYERGADLEIALTLGFEAAGPLRVWASPVDEQANLRLPAGAQAGM